eukprot:gene1171-15798_t
MRRLSWIDNNNETESMRVYREVAGKEQNFATDQKQKDGQKLASNSKTSEFNFIITFSTSQPKDGNGTIDVQELREVIRSLGNNPTEAELDQIINDADQDGSGTLDFEEFCAYLAGGDSLTHGKGTDSREIVESFRIFDTARNGMIAVDDFREASLYFGLGFIVVMMTMGDRLPADQVEEMIKMCDVDSDGTINYENFIAMVSNTSENLGLLDI